MKTMTGEIKAKGQLTVPKKIRDMLKLEEGQAVTFLAIGDSVIISPKRLDLDEARRQIRRIVKESGLTEEAILSDLKKGERSAVPGKVWQKEKLRYFWTPTSSSPDLFPTSQPPGSSWIYYAMTCRVYTRQPVNIISKKSNERSQESFPQSVPFFSILCLD